jgi:hypothetical protein
MDRDEEVDEIREAFEAGFHSAYGQQNPVSLEEEWKIYNQERMK